MTSLNYLVRIRFILILLASICLVACDLSSKSNLAVIEFQLKTEHTRLKCADSVEINDQTWQLRHFAFFLSQPRVVSENNTEAALRFKKNDWQTKDIALIQMSGDCDEAGKFNNTLHFSNNNRLPFPPKFLRFSLYVPFAQNHQNPLIQPSPLNNAEMFWSWRMGYKFLRLDMQSQHAAWSFHLGSVGCKSSAVVRPPENPCAQANYYEIELPYDASKSIVDIDLPALLGGIDVNLADNCMFEHSEMGTCQTLGNTLASAEIFKWQ